jgi:protein-tyrosine phosphatase
VATILVVCTGNICRSPMAERFLRHALEDRRIEGVTVESAGISGLDGHPAMPESVAALGERGIDLSEHLARRVDRRMIESADLILAMTSEHREAVEDLVPRAADRTFTLKELVHLLDRAGLTHEPTQRQAGEANGPSGRRLAAALASARALRDAGGAADLADEDVPDPLGLGTRAFESVAWELETLVERMVDRLFGPPGGEFDLPPPDGADHSGRPLEVRTKERGVR